MPLKIHWLNDTPPRQHTNHALTEGCGAARTAGKTERAVAMCCRALTEPLQISARQTSLSIHDGIAQEFIIIMLIMKNKRMYNSSPFFQGERLNAALDCSPAIR